MQSKSVDLGINGANDRDIAETRTQLKDKDIYQELKGNIEGPLEKIIKCVLQKVRNGKDMWQDIRLFFG